MLDTGPSPAQTFLFRHPGSRWNLWVLGQVRNTPSATRDRLWRERWFKLIPPTHQSCYLSRILVNFTTARFC